MTVVADIFVTRFAASYALGAEVAVTRLTTTATGVAHLVFALLTGVTVLGIDRVAAVRAPHAMPIFQCDIRTAAVVSL